MGFTSTTAIISVFAGAAATYSFVGAAGFTDLLNDFNAHSCTDQTLGLVLDNRLPLNGNTSYNPETGYCSYTYEDINTRSLQMMWKP